MWKPEVRERYLKGLETREMNIDPEILAKRNAHNSKKMKGRKPSTQTLKAAAEANKNRVWSEDEKKARLKGVHSKTTCPQCGLITNSGNMKRHIKARH